MFITRLFRPRYPEQECELLGMKFISPIGAYVKENETGIKYAALLLDHAYSYVIVNCKDLGVTIDMLRKLPREYNIIAHLDVKQVYKYHGSQKSMESAFALLYDFVDAFIISSIDSLSDDVDSLLNLRMYNDEYRPIILEIPSDLLYRDLDDILNYAMQNSVDACLISNPRLLKHAKEKCEDRISLIAGNVNSVEQMHEAWENGAELVCSESTHYSAFSLIRLGRKLLRQLHKDA